MGIPASSGEDAVVGSAGETLLAGVFSGYCFDGFEGGGPYGRFEGERVRGYVGVRGTSEVGFLGWGHCEG